jgi:hypothetical protein
MPVLSALATAAAREDTPNFPKMFSAWRFTVFGLRPSFPAIVRFEPPAAISASTSRSRAVRMSESEGAAHLALVQCRPGIYRM